MNRTERLVRQVADAMADGTPIGWEALISQAREPTERRALERLRQLEHLRAFAPSGARPAVDSAADAAVIAVAIISALQVTVAVVALLAESFQGRPLSWPLPQLAITVAFAAAAILLLRARHDRRALPLLAAYAAAAAAFCRPFVHAGDQMGLAAPLFVGVVMDAYLPACFWHFAAQFPRVTRFTRFDHFVRSMAAIAFAVGSGLLVVNLGMAYGAISTPLLASLWRGGVLYWAIFAVLLLSSVATVFWRATRATADERQKVRRFGMALFFGTAPFLIFQISMFLVPAFGRWARATPTPPARLPIDAVILAGFMLTPILTAGAVVVDRALDVGVLVRRATQYGLARVTLSASALVPFALLAGIVYINRDRRVTELLSGGVAQTLIAVGVTAFLLLIGRARLLALLDRAFFKNRLDHRAHLARALNRIRNARSRREVAAILANEGATVLGTERLVIFVPGPDDRFSAEIGAAAHLLSSSAIAALAEGDDRVLDLSRDTTSYSLLPRVDREWLDANALALFVPIRRRSGALDALLALGAKRDRLPITGEERWLMLSLSTAVAAVWESIGRADSEALGKTSKRFVDEESAVECARCGLVAERPPLPCECGAETRVAALPVMLQRKFRVIRRLGQGAMGVVYLGRDVDLARDVALKTLPAVTGPAIDRLRQEARAMATVSHEALAVIYGFEVWHDTPVLVVEYFRDGTLADRLRRGRLSVSDTLRLGIRLASGLSALHGAGLLHRDIKPTNIGLTDTGAAKLLDFGVAGIVNGFGELAGTPIYWPPEAFDGGGTSIAFDLWALNTVLYQAAAGRHPLAATTREGVKQWWRSSPKPLPRRPPGVPDGIGAYFDRALSARPDDRPPSAGDMERELAALLHVTDSAAELVRIDEDAR